MALDDTDWSDLDWRTYQKLVAGLHADEDTRVETEYDYPIHGGGTKEIDVVVWDTSGQYEYTNLIECKFQDKAVDQSVVDSVNGYFQNSDANNAVIVAKNGFQSGAVERAKGTGVKLLTIRQLIPGTDIPVEAMREANVTISINSRDLDIDDMEIEPLEDDEDGERKEVDHVFNPRNSQLYTTEREPLGETLIDRLNQIQLSEDVGEHTEQFDDKALLIRGNFYQLLSVDYTITENTSNREFSVDLFEDVDLLYRDEISGDEEFKSLSDALDSFKEHVQDDSENQ